jgi:hypothetical protein
MPINKNTVTDTRVMPCLSAEKLSFLREQVKKLGKKLPQNFCYNFKTKDNIDASLYFSNGKLVEYQEKIASHKTGTPDINYSYKDNNGNGSFEMFSIFTWDYGIRKESSVYRKRNDNDTSPYYRIK